MTQPSVIERLSGFLSWLGGADKEILAKVPQERARFAQMALVLLTTSSIALVSMIFALHDGVKIPLAVAVIGGIFWGFIILNLDRFLVLSMGATRTGRRLLLMALPRFLLASVISVVIATPLTLRVFQHDINVQVAKSQAAQSKQLNNLVSQSGPAQQASQLKTQIDLDEQTLAGHLPVTVTNPQLQDAQTAVNQLQPKVSAALLTVITDREAYQCELYGQGTHCAGASSKAGYGPIAAAKRTQYDDAQASYQSLSGQLQTAEKNLAAAQKSVSQAQAQTLAQDQTAARQALPGLEKSYATLEGQVKEAKSKAQNAVNNDNGLLAQLSGLSKASAGNPVLRLAQLLVMALFFLIEILPVSVKLLLNMGDKTTYETVAQAEEQKIVDRAKQERITARRDAERESDEQRKTRDSESRKRISAAEDMNKREADLSIRANEHVAKEMEAILDVALRDWSRQVRSTLGGNSQAAGGPVASGTAGPSPNGSGASGNGNGAGGNGNGQSPPGGPGASGKGSGVGNLPPMVTPPMQSFGLPDDDDLLA